MKLNSKKVLLIFKIEILAICVVTVIYLLTIAIPAHAWTAQLVTAAENEPTVVDFDNYNEPEECNY